MNDDTLAAAPAPHGPRQSHAHARMAALAERGKVVSAADAMRLVHDGDMVATGGFVGIGFPENIAVALEAFADAGVAGEVGGGADGEVAGAVAVGRDDVAEAVAVVEVVAAGEAEADALPHRVGGPLRQLVGAGGLGVAGGAKAGETVFGLARGGQQLVGAERQEVLADQHRHRPREAAAGVDRTAHVELRRGAGDALDEGAGDLVRLAGGDGVAGVEGLQRQAEQPAAPQR